MALLTSEIADQLISDQGVNVNIPNNYTAIGDAAFRRKSLASVTIPSTITSIARWAFETNNLTTLDIPDSVTFIGEKAFSDNQLQSVKISTGLTSLAGNTFSSNRLTAVEIPKNVDAIGDAVFRNNRLKSITFPEGVQTLGWAVAADNNLTSIDIPKSVRLIRPYAFSNNSLSSVTIPDGVRDIEWYAFEKNDITDIQIPDNVRSTGSHAFADNPLKRASISADTDLHSKAFPSDTEIIIRGLPPTFTISHSKSSVSENDRSLPVGESLFTNIETTNFADGKFLYYSIEGSGISREDFSTPLTGNIRIDSGKGQHLHTLVQDKLTEGDESFVVKLFTDLERQQLVATSSSVKILDTSKTPAKASYSIDFSSDRVKEGDILTSTISTINVDPGTLLYWSFSGSGINGADFSSGSIKGSSAIDKSGEFTLTHAIAEDQTTEGSEALKLQLFSDAKRKDLLSQESLTIVDTSKEAQIANLTDATVDGNLLTLSFDASLANTTPNTARFSVKAAGSAVAVRAAKVQANAGILELTLASIVKPNQSVRLSYSDIKGDQSFGVLETPDGTDLASFSTSVTNTNKDTKAPAVTSAFIKDKTLTLSFSEDISSVTPSNRRWTVKEDGVTIPVDFSKVDTATAQLDLQLSNAVDGGSNVTLSYSDLEGNQSSGVIEDLSGNDLASIFNLAVTNRTQRSTQPLNVNTAQVDGDSITIAFDRELASTRPNTGTFRVTANGKAIEVTDIKLKPDNREALLTLKSPVAFGDSVALSYTDAQGNQKSNVIEDLEGNDLATLSNLNVTNNTRKSTSDLKVDYADADGSTINLYFTDTLSGSIPKASRFRVTANQRRQRIDSVTTEPREGIVSLNLRQAISSEQDILISYRDFNGDQASGVIEDLDGNDLPSFAKLSPINDSIDSDPPTLEDAYLDGKELILEFDELIQAGKLSKSRFKVRAGKKRVRVISAEVPEDDAIAILNLKSPLAANASNLSLTYRDLKGDQNSKIIQDLDGNDLESFRNFDVEIL